jgi:phosphoglycolate phosphatase
LATDKNFPFLDLLVWDLDGTLIDSGPDLVAAVNAALTAMGRAPLPEAEVARYVGDGAARLMQRALGLEASPGPAFEPLGGEAEAQAARGLELFLAHYAEHKLDHTVLYPGVSAGLEALAAAGYQMAVLTNKPVRPSREIVDGLGLGGRFCAVYGGDSFDCKKPDPVGLRTLLAERGVEAARAAMIGDSAVDVRTGRAAGVWTWGVSYGFAPAAMRAAAPDWIASDFTELCRHLLQARTAPPAPRSGG